MSRPDARSNVTGPGVRAVMPRVLTPLRIFPETIILDGVPPPIAMAAFPAMKMFQPDRIADQPDPAMA